MNRKGFTLTEIIGTIVILAVIAAISVPIITSTIRRNREKLYQTQLEEIEKAAVMLLSETPTRYPTAGNPCEVIYVEELIVGRYIEEGNIINPHTSETFTGCIRVRLRPEVTDYQDFTFEYLERDDCSC